MIALVRRLLLIVLSAAVILWCGQTLYERWGPDALVLPYDLLEHAQGLARDGRLAEAAVLARFVEEHPDLGDAAQASLLAGQWERELDSLAHQARRFAEGMVSGEPKDTPSLLGAISLDLFVLGDLRDLIVQGYKEWRDGSGDEVILALSAVGLVTTLAPELDWAPALTKAFYKAGAITRRFAASLADLSRRALRSGDFAGLRRVTTDLGETATRLGPGPLRGALKAVDEAGDLTRLAGAARIDARGSYALSATFGADGLRRLSADGGNIAQVLRTVKTAARAVKIGDKTLAVLPPTAVLGILLLAGAVWAGNLYALLAWGGRKTRRTGTPAS